MESTVDAYHVGFVRKKYIELQAFALHEHSIMQTTPVLSLPELDIIDVIVQLD